MHNGTDEPLLAYWIRVYHPSILFVLGLGGIIYETVATNVDRPYLLALFAAMAGVLPATIFDAILGRRGSADGESTQDRSRRRAPK
jgi:hypothetical protein